MPDPSPSLQLHFISLLGAGGYGKVYLAKKLGVLSTKCAVKLPLGGSRELLRLYDEAQILSMLNHPGIVKVTDFVRIGPGPALVMELVEGITLARAREDLRRLPIRAALEVVKRVAGALDYAWSSPSESGQPLRLKHRDISPRNIMITRFGEVKLLDFGLATANMQREAQTLGTLPGSLGYRSPERIIDQTCEAPADIYALGAVLYEILGGDNLGSPSLPIEPGAFEQWLSGRMQSLEARLGSRQLRGDPEQVFTLMRHMLEFDPEARVEARDVVEMVDYLLPNADGASLDAWCQVEVPRVRQATERTGEDSYAGRTWEARPVKDRADWLVEPPTDPGLAPARQPSAGETPSSPPSPRRRTAKRVAGGGGLVGLISFIWKLWGSGEEVKATDGPAAPSAETQPTPPPADPVPSEPVPPPAEPDHKEVKPEEAKLEVTNPMPDETPKETIPAEPTPAPPPPKPAPTTANVGFKSSNVKTVTLINSKGDKFVLPQSKLPPGTYTIKLENDRAPHRVTNPVTFKAGDRKLLNCDYDTSTCN